MVLGGEEHQQQPLSQRFIKQPTYPIMNRVTTFFITLFAFIISTSQGHSIDVLTKGGHMIDPKNNIDAVMAVAIAADKIVELAPKINKEAKKVIDATGLYV